MDTIHFKYNMTWFRSKMEEYRILTFWFDPRVTPMPSLSL